MIAEGYPKLALWNGPIETLPFYRPRGYVTLPNNHRQGRWWRSRYDLKKEELIILVNGIEQHWYPHWNSTKPILYTYYWGVPWKAIERGIIPSTCVWKWKKSYDKLPPLASLELTLLSPEYVTKWMKNENSNDLKSTNKRKV